MLDWIVVGGGFGGVCAAYLLARKGHSVCLIEQDGRLGGAVNGFEWNGFRLDLGCQVLDNKDAATAEIYLDLLHGDSVPVEHRIASVTHGQRTEGIELPDLATCGEDVCRKILWEIIAAAERPDTPSPNLQRRFEARFGPTAAGIVGRMTEDLLLGLSPELLSDEGLDATPFRRIKFLSEEQALVLKRIDVFDERIVAARKYRTGTKHISSHIFYPKTGGMRGFFESALRRVRELGVTCLLDRKVEKLQADGAGIDVTLDDGEVVHGNYLFWARGIVGLAERLRIDRVSALKDTVHRVPIVIFYFSIKQDQQGSYCYIHDFDPGDLTFRGSTPGGYGNGICPAGLSYACAEVYTKLGSEVWNAPESKSRQVWSELVRHGVVTGGEPIDSAIRKMPASNWRVGKVGFPQAKAAVQRRLDQQPRIRFSDDFVHGRAETIASVKDALAGFV
jgi:protoporphyrinogen oxidase